MTAIGDYRRLVAETSTELNLLAAVTDREMAREEIATCAISGAVGTFANVDPAVEAYVAEKLGLSIEPVSTQIIPRDRHALYFATLGVIASSIERLATEIRHLQRTEVLEAEEPFDPGQKGSSAMPHKRNPVLSENLTGLARLVRSAAIPAMERPSRTSRALSSKPRRRARETTCREMSESPPSSVKSSASSSSAGRAPPPGIRCGC